MNRFKEIYAAACKRAGGEAALAGRLPTPKDGAALRALADHRYLSQMSLRIFRAGLKHSLVDNKWPAFEEAFEGFEPRRVRAMSDEAVEALMSDKRLIRHWGKIKSVRANAAAMCEIADERGTFGAYVADWPAAEIVDLWADLARRFTQLGGNSGAYFLRMVGKDTFILTPFVVRALNRWGVIDGEAKSKGARREAEAAMNSWAAESGRPLSQISMILAQSVE